LGGGGDGGGSLSRSASAVDVFAEVPRPSGSTRRSRTRGTGIAPSATCCSAAGLHGALMRSGVHCGWPRHPPRQLEGFHAHAAVAERARGGEELAGGRVVQVDVEVVRRRTSPGRRVARTPLAHRVAVVVPVEAPRAHDL
jgi:hypothetical protein